MNVRFDQAKDKDTIVKQFYQSIKDAGQSQKKFCIVFDNAESMTDVANYLPDSNTFPDLRIDILVTFRYLKWERPFYSTVEVAALGKKDTQTYISSSLTDDHNVKPGAAEVSKDMERLHELLGGLPLAISQAIAYIQQSNISISKFCDLVSEISASKNLEQGSERLNFASPTLSDSRINKTKIKKL